jgi:hypothetical protein
MATKIKRKEFAHFINVTPSSTASYEQLGVDLEALEVSMNMNVETFNNILGQASVNISNGTKTASIEPYFADKDTALFTLLQGFIDNNSELEELATDIVEVKKYETEGSAGYPAMKKEVKIEIVSYGGDNSGYQIPFNLHFTGVDVAGEYDLTTGAFTAD